MGSLAEQLLLRLLLLPLPGSVEEGESRRTIFRDRERDGDGVWGGDAAVFLRGRGGGQGRL